MANNKTLGNEGLSYFWSKLKVLLAGKLDVTGTAVKSTLSSGLYFGTTSASTTAMTVTIDGITEYYTGLMVVLKMGAAPESGCTVNINSLGAKELRWKAQAAGTYFASGALYLFVYDGTYLTAIHSYDSNQYDRLRVNAAQKARSAIVAKNIIVNNGNGYAHLKTGNAFDITYPILWAMSNISTGSTGTNNYLSFFEPLETTQSGTWTAYQPVYIKGSLSGTTFTPISTTPLTQTVPTSEDGYQYILLGQMYSTTNMVLLPDHPIYAYQNGSFGLYQNTSNFYTKAEVDELVSGDFNCGEFTDTTSGDDYDCGTF